MREKKAMAGIEKLKKNVHIDASQDLMKPVVVNLEKEKY